MAGVNDDAIWEGEVYQLEETDAVQGGKEGVDNRPHWELARRTAFLKKQHEEHVDPAKAAGEDPHPQYLNEERFNENLKDVLEIKYLVGLTWESHHPGAVPGWIDLKGGEFSRTTDKLLWDYANDAGMVVPQVQKDADPMANAMKFGDGDGSTTFTVPNHHLKHFTRGTPVNATHGETQGDAIREIEGRIGGENSHSYLHAYYHHSDEIRDQYITGAFSGEHLHTSDIDGGAGSGQNATIAVNFKASNVVPTADENRPYTANLSIKMHRGWM